MDHQATFLFVAALGAFFMAFNNGANDVANSFASAVGSKAITIKQALFIASIMNLLGALLLGGHVAAKLIEEVINPKMFADPVDYVIAMVSVMLAAGSFVLYSTLTGMPVSSSHAIVASLTGVSIVVAGWASVNWLLIGVIVLSWVISPFLAGSLSWLMAWCIKRFVVGSGGSGTKRRVQQWVPILLALTMGAALYALFKGTRLPHVVEAHMFEVLLLAFFGGFVVYFGSQAVIEQWMRDEPDTVSASEGVFRRLQVGTSSYVSFAHGSNDVANSIAPVFAIYLVASRGGIPENLEGVGIPFWILVLGGCGIAVGVITLGHRVMTTLGERITVMTNSKGFSVDFSVGTTVAIASLLGIPVSTTHAATGAIVGSGLTEGVRSINFGVFGRIIISWLITIPVAAAGTVLIYLGLSSLLH